MRLLHLPAAGFALLALSACETTDPDLGYSVRRAVVAQAVDMNPSYAGLPIEGSSGVRALDAQRRYLKGAPRALSKIDGRVNETGSANTGADSGGRAAPATGSGNSN